MGGEDRCLIISTCGCLISILGIIGFALSRFIIYQKGRELPHFAYSCGSFPPNITSFSASKQVLSQWQWKYSFEQFDGYIMHHCPHRGVDIYVDGQLSAHGVNEGVGADKIVTLFDCHENKIAEIRIGKRQTNILGKPIDTGMEIRSRRGNVVALTDGHHDWTDTVAIQDIFGNEIAYLERRKYSLDWIWEFTIFDTLQLGADPRILSVLAGEFAFDSTSHSDSCNNFYNLAHWLEWICGAILLVLTTMLLWYSCANGSPFWYCKAMRKFLKKAAREVSDEGTDDEKQELINKSGSSDQNDSP